ncbi:MAG: tRNA (5-methylaminomethyl-2-thiouridine)(34)-methyltransferase MnmD [Chitinispirillales bacterium]|nr:tRNA (5-methylaminomethyl-2-thiouridine)(34)-methyltransferase MnmD [Chitinispirillales bacterium]
MLNKQYDDRYFDVINALEEAKHIHIRGSRFADRLKNGFRIGETGFGAGRMLIAVIEALESANVPDIEIHYSSVELYPMSLDKMTRILNSFRDRAGHLIDKLIDVYSRFDLSARGWHHGIISGGFGVVNLHLFIGEALEMAASMAIPCDAWFLDGHDPAKNPDMWRAELLSEIGRKTARGGTVTTFSVAGHVRRNLTAAGFSVEKVPGHGRKREALRGDFSPEISCIPYKPEM